MDQPTFTVVAQSPTKLRVTFSHVMANAGVLYAPSTYELKDLTDGTEILVSEVRRIGDGVTRFEFGLSDDLEPFAAYSLAIVDESVVTFEGEALFPAHALVQWQASVPRPIRIRIAEFSGEVSGGLLGSPAGQVFVSPAFNAPVGNSSLEIANVAVCTKAYDVYTIPSLPDPLPLYTFPALAGTSSALGPSGSVLWAPAHRLGQAVMALADLREDEVAPPTDGPAEGLLVEPIDITRASFLNDDRWRTFPGTGATLGAFRTADNLSPIGAGPTIGPFAIG